MKTSLWFPLLLALFVFSGCSGSGKKESPAVKEKSVTESAQDYLMNPVRQKKKAIKELDEALAKRDAEISRQLEEATKR